MTDGTVDVALLVFDGARQFDVAVAREVWQDHASSPGALVAPLVVCGDGPVHLSTGASTTPGSSADTDIDTDTVLRPAAPTARAATADLVLVPGTHDRGESVPASVLAALRAAHAAGAHIASLCGGAFVLGRAGLLRGRRATTHWDLCGELARRHPDTEVDPEPLFVQDGRVWTAAGVAAGIDLCLALVRELHGGGTATHVARAVVAGPHRDGGQAQFIDRPVAPAPETGVVGPVAGIVEDDLAHPWTAAELARMLHMAERTLVRRFGQESGTTLHRWITHARIARARELLETTAEPVERIARTVGFGSTPTFRTRFRTAVGLSPSAYRARFSHGTPDPRVIET
ncbi:GlxA family transcriptional regulator [Brevibacterium litoralis]|uniref:GlxA family transcriptional regulator n=1 Tax=Brevibacterium litoralis TaxID=3138935 RepID=UPI0032EA90EA